MQGERLRQVREEKHISQRDLARLCNVGLNMIYRYESNLTDPTADVLKRIAMVLDVSTDYLTGLTEDPQGCLGGNELSPEERALIQRLRHEGWAGVGRLSLEQLEK